MLEQIFKLTDPEHPDLETMPLTLTILSDFVKSTQPGVQVADAKVKFWSLCEALVYRPGEIIVSLTSIYQCLAVDDERKLTQINTKDMDLYDPQRHLVDVGIVYRKTGSDWREVTLALLDNYSQLYPPLNVIRAVV